MTELVLLSVLPVLAVVVGSWLVVRDLTSARLMVRRRVVVNLVDGQALNGVLWARRGRHLVLRDTQLLEPGVAPVDVDGDVVVDRDRVLFVQAVG